MNIIKIILVYYIIIQKSKSKSKKLISNKIISNFDLFDITFDDPWIENTKNKSITLISNIFFDEIKPTIIKILNTNLIYILNSNFSCIENQISFSFYNKDIKNFSGFFYMEIIFNNTSFFPKHSFIFSKYKQPNKNNIITNYLLLILPNEKNESLITFNSIEKYEEEIYFIINCGNYNGTFNKNYGEIKIKGGNNFECTFIFDNGFSTLNSNFYFYVFTEMNKYILLSPNFLKKQCFYINDTTIQGTNITIKKNNFIINDKDIFIYLLSNHFLYINNRNINVTYSFSKGKNYIYYTNDLHKFYENETYNFYFKERKNGNIIFNTELKFTNIELPNYLFGLYENKFVYINLTSYCDLSDNHFIITGNKKRITCQKNIFINDDFIYQIKCNFDESDLNYSFNVFYDNKNVKIKNFKEIKISRYLNDIKLTFKVNNIGFFIDYDNIIEIICSSENNFYYNQIQKVFIKKIDENNKESIIIFSINDNINKLYINDNKIYFFLKPKNLLEKYIIQYLSNENESINNKNISNNNLKPIKEIIFKISKQYLFLINNNYELKTKLICESNEKAIQLNKSLIFKENVFNRIINGNNIILIGNFYNEKDIEFTYKNINYHIYIIKISFETCFEILKEETKKIKFNFISPLNIDFIVKSNYTICINNICEFNKINDYYIISVIVKNEESEIGNIKIYEKNNIKLIKQNYLEKKENQELIFYLYDNSFIYDSLNHNFLLIESITQINIISPLFCSQNINTKEIKCIFNLLNSNNGIYNLILKDKNKCYINSIITNKKITLGFKINDSYLKENGLSNLIITYFSNLEKKSINEITLIKSNNNSIIISSNEIEINDTENYFNNEFTIKFDLSEEKNQIIKKGEYDLKYILNNHEIYYNKTIIINEQCKIPLISNGKGNCINCEKYFDFDKKNIQQNKRCVDLCNKYYFENICYSNCSNVNEVKNNSIYYYNPKNLKETQCTYLYIINFESENNTIINIEEQDITFIYPYEIDFNKISFLIKINDLNKGNCILKSKLNKIKCIFNLSNILNDTENISITFNINSFEYKNNNPKININVTKESCNKLKLGYLKLDKNYCLNCTEQKKYKYNNNGTCVSKCEKPNNLIIDKSLICTNICKNLYQKRNNLTFCVEKCDEGFGYDISRKDKFECIICSEDKIIINSQCIKLNEIYPIKRLSNYSLNPISFYNLSIQFDKQLNKSEIKQLILMNNTIEKYSSLFCNVSFYNNNTLNCIFNLSLSNNGFYTLKFIIYNNKFINYEIQVKILNKIICNKKKYKVRDLNDNTCKLCRKISNKTIYFNINDNLCYEKCPFNTYLFNLNYLCVNDCYLYNPKYENDEKNKICLLINTCKDYCKNNGKCYNNGIIRCFCYDNFSGLRCGIVLNLNTFNLNLYEKINIIKDFIEDYNKLNFVSFDDEFINAIKEVSLLINDIKKLNVDNDDLENKIFKNYSFSFNLIQNFVIQIQEEEIKNKYKYFNDNLIHITSLSIYYQVNLLKNLRKLNNVNGTILKNLIINTKNEYYSFIKSLNFTNLITNSFHEIFTYDNLINIIILPNLKNAYEDYINYCKIENLPFISISNKNLTTSLYNELYLIISFNYKILSSLNFESPSHNILLNKFSVIYDLDDNIKSINEISLNNYIINLPINEEKDSKFNKSLLEYYLLKGINIYNKYDKAFQDKCYSNKKLNIDYTQKLRRKNLYQNYTITSINDNCIYINNNENNLNYFSMKCLNSNNISYYLKEDFFNENENININEILFKCFRELIDVKNNFGFCVYIIIIIIFFIFEIIAYMNYNKNIENKNSIEIIQIQNENNEIYSINNNDSIINEKQNTETQNLNKNIDNKYIDNSDKNILNKDEISIYKTFYRNLFDLHSLLSIFNISNNTIKKQNKIFIFFNSIINIFGWNVIYINDKLIEKRIINNLRNNFLYPIQEELKKILLSIFTTMIVTFIIRLINLNSFKNKKNNYSFYKFIFGIMIIIFLLLFFWFYCTMFCFIFINSQINFLYSSIWSLIINFIIFISIYIFIISIIEKYYNNDILIYYIKELFLF